MQTRTLAGKPVSAIGLGCMNLSHAYGEPPPAAEGERLLLRALELGVTHFDTAALYGFGRNETLVGRTLKPHRDRIFLASKCGMTGVDGKRVIDGRPETLKRTCDESLQRLQTDHIDLYYLHRWDKTVPIEDSVGALAELKQAGKINAIGLSEVSAATLRKAHAVHPIAAVQSEYSMITRNPEIAVLDACADLGAAFVAFSPVARGMLAGGVNGNYSERDIRRGMPRFNPPHLAANLKAAATLAALAREASVTPAQLALIWLLDRGEHVLPIPGTASIAHLDDDIAAGSFAAPAGLIAKIDATLATLSISGDRYPPATQAEVDTER